MQGATPATPPSIATAAAPPRPTPPRPTPRGVDILTYLAARIGRRNLIRSLFSFILSSIATSIFGFILFNYGFNNVLLLVRGTLRVYCRRGAFDPGADPDPDPEPSALEASPRTTLVRF